MPQKHRTALVRCLISSLCILTGGAVFAQAAPSIKPPHLAAGLRNMDGTPHVTPPPNKVTGKTLDVTKFGADPADNANDDRPGIEAALNEAKPGDELYFPNGTYNLITSTNNPNVHILLKSGVNLRGESEAGVKLISSFDAGTSSRTYTIMRGQDVSDIYVSNMTLTSTWNKTFPTDPRKANPERGGPLNAIAIESSIGKNERITFERVTVERFVRMGFRIAKGSSNVVIRNCTARNATDVAGGGAGYGFVFMGSTHVNSDINPFLGTGSDNFFNVLENSTAEGPYIRHGALIQYWGHNNVIRNNTFKDVVYDAIDLHGEDEYLNEIANNVITGTSQGAAIGLGNSGAGHDKTGPWNWVHHNSITASKRGIVLEYGTNDNVIEYNLIQGNNTIEDSFGISLGSVKNNLIRENVIVNNNVAGFSGIRLIENRAEGDEPAGSPSNNRIERNTITGNKGPDAKAIRVESTGPGNVFLNNIVKDNTDNSVPQ